MNRLSVVVAVLSAVSCVCGKPCTTSADCGSPGYCEVSLGVCVLPDGGTGGGAAGGAAAGGGVTGGGGGGSTGGGGGSAGGTAPTLTKLNWESPDGGPTALAALPLVVTTLPLSFDAGPSLTAVVTAPDGGSTNVTLLAGPAGRYGSTSPTLTDGTWRAYVGSGGVDASVAFVVDRTAATVQLFVEPHPARDGWEVDSVMPDGWKKDELALVQVEASEPVVVRPQDFMNPGVAAAAGCVRVCATGKSCSCFSVDLAVQPMPAPRGTVTVTLKPVADALGNMSANATTMVEVTRWKWMQQVVTGASTVVSAPVLTSSGRVVVAGFAGSTGQVLAFEPTGALVWGSLDGGAAVTAGPVVGSQGIYVATQEGNNSSIVRLDVMTGAVASQQYCADVGGGLRFDGDLTLTVAAADVVFGTRNGFLYSTAPTCPATPVTTNGRVSLVASGTGSNSELFLGSASRGVISKYGFSASAWSPLGSTATFSLFPQGLFLFGTLVGGGGGGPTTGGAFLLSSLGVLDGGVPSQYAPNGTDPGGAAVVGGDAGSPWVLFGNQGKALVRVNASNSSLAGSPADSVDAGSDVSLRSPLLGEGAKLYVVGADRVLRVFNQSPLFEEWQWPTIGGIQGTTAVSQLALDVARTGPAKDCAKPGTLYVAAAQGNVGRLYAFIVDSKGLDVNAPWPKYQHDNANTGNPATALSSWSCP